MSKIQCFWLYNIQQYDKSVQYHYKITVIKQNWLFMAFQETANSDSAWDLTIFANLINFANFIRNRFEFEDIMLINFATDGQDVLVENSLLKLVYKGQTNKKWNSDSSISIEQRRQILFSRGTSMWRPSSISKLCALRRTCQFWPFEMHSLYFSNLNSVLNWQ